MPRSRPATLYRRLHDRLSARGDTEHEQALIRIGIIGVLLAYAMVGPLPAPIGPPWAPTVPQLGWAVWTLSVLHFGWVVVDPAVRPVRRALWCLVDHVAIVAAMALGGSAMALLYPLLLWVTLGHGFRYGSAYMIGSALISVGLFLALVTLHPYWQLKGALAIGLVLGLVLIPAYCLRLLRHLHDARRRAEASSEAKSRFLATMSHELRTPLHAILGMTDLLRARERDPDRREMLRTIHTSGHGLLTMIEDILDIARIEAGAERVEVERFDVHRLLHDVRDMLAHRAAGKGLALQLRVDPELVAELAGPRRAIQQILVNLVANAVKFTDSGFVRIEAALSATAGDGAGRRLELAVVDTGCGIPPSAQPRIFDSFSQVDESSTRRHGGSGLGLAIVKRLVEGAAGAIRLDSAPGRGSRFDVALPVRPEGDPPPPTETVVVVHGTPSPAQRRVLDAAVPSWCAGTAAAGDAPTARTVDLWCASGGAPPQERRGRALVSWGAAPGAVDALVALPADASAAMLARAVRAAVVNAVPGADGEAPRVRSGARSLDVLVADDHTVNRQVIDRLLTQVGHRVELVGDGAAALTAARGSRFDAVVLDLNMPELSGLDVARHLVADGERPRLVALTADATAATRDACRRAGFDAYLTKPVDSAELIEAVAVDGEPASPPDEPNGTRAEPAPAAAADVLDLTRLEMLHQLGDAAFVREIVETFVADGERLVDELATAAEAGDVAGFRDAAHALRSAATHLGATALFERCLAVKSIAAEDLRANSAELRVELAATFATAAHALRAAAAVEPAAVSRRAACSGSGPAAPSSAGPAVPARAPAPPTAR